MRRVGWVAALLVLVAARGATAGEAPAKGKAMNLAFVLLSEAKLPRGEDVEKAFAEFALKGQRLHFQGKKTAKGGGETLELALGAGGTATVALMPAPVPNHEADDAVRFSVSAFGGRWKLPPHKAHLVVTAFERAPPAEALSSFTALLAAVAMASGAVGIYCGNAGATHDPAFFQEVARERDPTSSLALWSGVSIAKEPGGRLSLLTLGMKQLSLPDVLLSVPAAKGDGALGQLFDLVGYLVYVGKAPVEGETFGRRATEKLTVHYVSSPVDPKVKVWRVEMP